MGHQICERSFPYTTSKSVISAECNSEAEKYSDCGSALYSPIRFITSKVYESQTKAEEAIEALDNGWYDSIAVPYLAYEGVKVVYTQEHKRTVERYQEADKKYRALAIKQHYTPQTVTSKTVSCKHCGTRYMVEHLRGNRCCNCGQDLRPKSTLDRLEKMRANVDALHQRCNELADKCRRDTIRRKKLSATKMWLVKYEYHV